jgi:hypothetical protein
MLDESLVFHKTARGAEEIGGATRTLAAKLRRALIMVDGVKSVAELAPMFRQGEIDAILEELQAGGFVSLQGGEVAVPVAAPGMSAPATGAQRFQEAKRAAMREVMDRLGPNGDTLAVKIERASSPSELRAALGEAERVFEAFLGQAAARAFVQKIGRDLGG